MNDTTEWDCARQTLFPYGLQGVGCPNEANHTHGPQAKDGSADIQKWFEWAAQMEETHEQTECPDCKLYLIWKPLPAKIG